MRLKQILTDDADIPIPMKLPIPPQIHGLVGTYPLGWQSASVSIGLIKFESLADVELRLNLQLVGRTGPLVSPYRPRRANINAGCVGVEINTDVRV